MMNRYRIIKINNFFYLQKRFLFLLWFYSRHVSGQKLCFNSLKEAREGAAECIKRDNDKRKSEVYEV